MQFDKPIKKSHSDSVLFKATFGLCFLFLYCLPFAGVSGFWLDDFDHSAERTNPQGLSFSDQSHSVWENSTLFQFSPKPKQQDAPEETDSDADENSVWNKWLLSVFLNRLSDDIGSKTGFVYRSSLLQTRREVALFVLHHSWRTFIF